MKVLIAEDNDDLRTIMANLLRENGYKVTTASDGKEALEIFLNSGEEYSFLVTDFNMPYLNGGELIESLYKNKIFVKNIIIFSALATNEKLVSKLLTEYPNVKFLEKSESVYKLLDVLKTELAAKCT